MGETVTQMGETKKQPRFWWLESNFNRQRRSPWLQSTLAALDEKTKAMLKLIEEDADSFAQRAEMYYKKRPQLISMVEDFYRAHRSLAERCDQIKSDPGSRLVTTLGSPHSTGKCQSEKSTCTSDQNSDCHSEAFGPEESAEFAESDVDDPEEEAESPVNEEEDLNGVEENEEVEKMREEVEKLREENRVQRDELMQKDEEKREVIRQLSVAVEVLKEENVNLWTRVAKNSPVKCSPFEFIDLKWGFWRYN